LRCSVEHLHAFWCVHLGPAHPLAARLQECHPTPISKVAALELVVPRNNLPKCWVSALLPRRLHIDCQVWMSDQARSDCPSPIPALIEVFSEIARKRDWAPDLPPRHFQLDPPSRTPSVGGGMLDLTDHALNTDFTRHWMACTAIIQRSSVLIRWQVGFVWGLLWSSPLSIPYF
jgi:hypothetical protein